MSEITSIMDDSSGCPCVNHAANRQFTLAALHKILQETDPVCILTEFISRMRIPKLNFLEEPISAEHVDIVPASDKIDMNLNRREYRGKKTAEGRENEKKKARFACQVKLNGTVISGLFASSNKMDGRKRAASDALEKLASAGTFKLAFLEQQLLPSNEKSLHFARMAGVVHKAFNNQAVQFPVWLDCKDVLSAFVIRAGSGDPGTVVAMATGNRCILGTNLVEDGTVVHDCHADVVVRRALMRFLYNELDLYVSGKNSIFEDNLIEGKLRLKSNIAFHYFVSTAPCGDAREFIRSNWTAPVVLEEPHLHVPLFEGKTTGCLRAKLQSGNGAVFTFDNMSNGSIASLRGRRLFTMSCSDKILQWNVVGVQGALLAIFMEPIFISSITIGTFFNAHHFARAFCCRMEEVAPGERESQPESYLLKKMLNHPWIGTFEMADSQVGDDLDEKGSSNNSTSLSTNWTWNDDGPEILDGRKGLPHSVRNKTASQYSRLSKRALFERFRACYHAGYDKEYPHSYSSAKMLSKVYLDSKRHFHVACETAGYGPWLTKPTEVDEF